MENKPPVYTSLFPDNRNFCSRLSFSKVYILFLSCVHSAHTKRLYKTPHTHTPLCSYSFLILYLNDELVKMKNQIWDLSLHKCSKNNLILIDWGSLENTDQFITPKIALSNLGLEPCIEIVFQTSGNGCWQ